MRLRRRYTSQPTGQASIDWTNPHARDLVLATYAEDASLFRNMVDGRLSIDGGGPNAFSLATVSKGGRGKNTRGSSYTNRFAMSPQGAHHRGKMTLLLVYMPKISNGATSRYLVSGGENSGGWNMARLGMATGDRVIGSCVNGAVLTSDAPITLGDVHVIGFTNYATGTPSFGRQRLYVDGVKQSAEGTYAGNWPKFIDTTSVGSGLANHADIYAIFAWARELSETEMADISANPYQLFAREIRVSKPTLAKTIHNLVGSAATQLASLASGVIKAIVNLGGSGASSAGSASTAQVTQQQQLAIAPMSQAATASAGQVSVAVQLGGSSAGQGNAASAAAVGQIVGLGPSNATQGNSATTGTIDGALGLSLAPCSQSAAASSGTIGITVQLGASSMTQTAQASARPVQVNIILGTASSAQMNYASVAGLIADADKAPTIGALAALVEVDRARRGGNINTAMRRANLAMGSRRASATPRRGGN